MKKNLIYFFAILFCLTLNLSFQSYFFIHPFNHSSVKNNIEYLCSDNFKGRLAGTLENEQTTIYIKNSFKDNGLKPYDGSYFHSFNTVYPHRIEGNPYLRVTDANGFIVKDYKYGIDFKEDLLNFKENNIKFAREDSIGLRDDCIQIKKEDKYFLFYVPNDNNLQFRSSFISTSPHSMYVMITKDAFNELNHYIKDNFNINCFIPFETKNTSLNNIAAYIEGKNAKIPPIIISAHFDHVGTDLAGTVYSGALDNASGTSFIMEMSKYVKSLGTPQRNIIFVGFNAEEFGCLGSKAFLNKYKKELQGSKLFNFDMIGSNNSVPLYIMGGKKDTKDTNLIKEVSSICLKNKIDFNYLFEDASDHEAFRKDNIDAVTLSDADSSRIHTPTDKSSFIDTTSIDRCFKVASNEIIKCGFNNNIFLIYYKQLFFISLIGIVISYKYIVMSKVR